MTGWLRTDDTTGRVYAPDAAAMVLAPQVMCAATRELRPLLDACFTVCLATCGHAPQWTEVGR